VAAGAAATDLRRGAVKNRRLRPRSADHVARTQFRFSQERFGLGRSTQLRSLRAELDDIRASAGILNLGEIDECSFDRLAQMVVRRRSSGQAEKRTQQENGALVVIRDGTSSITL
jgi:hypothetical protein